MQFSLLICFKLSFSALLATIETYAISKYCSNDVLLFGIPESALSYTKTALWVSTDNGNTAVTQVVISSAIDATSDLK